MKLFIAQESAWAAQPAELSPVLAFHWEGISVSEREAGRANPASPFTLTDQPGSADIHVLPYEWNYYIWTQKINEARAQAMQAAIYDKQILVWHSGDLPPIIPLPNAICFQSALYRSRLRANQHAVPFFVADPLPQHSNGQVKLRRKGERPVVGFCGYAGVVLPKMAYGVYANLKHNLLFRLGRAPYEAMPVLPATLLRARTTSAPSNVTISGLMPKSGRGKLRHSIEICLIATTFSACVAMAIGQSVFTKLWPVGGFQSLLIPIACYQVELEYLGKTIACMSSNTSWHI
jgi:hypothetical protein